jgi:hypothetical protein
MLKRVKIMTLPLILAAILIVLTFPGCDEKAADDGTGASQFTQQELQDVLADSIIAVENADTYRFTLDINMDIEVTGVSDAGKMEISMRADGVANITDDEMQTDLDMYMELDIPGMDGGSQDMSAEVYMLNDWLYIKAKMTDVDEQWVKTPATEDIMGAYSMNMVDQQITPLESMTDIKFIKYESLDGSQCYVLEIIPDTESMKELLNDLQLTAETTDWSELMADMFRELSYKVWVDKDTKQMKKLRMTMNIEMDAEQAGVSDADFDKMTLDMEMEMTMKDYNEPVSITLPDEAEDAVEM